MSIRYQCDECGSVLKVKDELAGTAGKCPKCKKKFVVPQPDDATATSKPAPTKPAPTKEPAEKSASPKEPRPAETAAKPKPPKQETPTEEPIKPAVKAKPADDDFDVDAFLMADGPVATPPFASADAGAATSGAGRTTGRKRIVPAVPGDEPLDAQGRTQPGATDTSANARDLLSKNMDDARVKASAMPEAKTRESFFDFSGVKQEAKQAAPYAVGFVVLLLGIWWMSNAIFGSNLKLPPLARVSGSVTFGGEPMPNIRVNLTPVDQKIEVDGKEMRPRSASGVTDKDGYFELEYQEGIRGAYIGKSRIWVEPLDVNDMKKIPPRYLSISNDIREVREAGNEGKFNLEF